MDNNGKVNSLKDKLNRLIIYKHSLTSKRLGEFELLKREICEELDEKQRIRFNQIQFYSEVPAVNYDDLPF